MIATIPPVLSLFAAKKMGSGLMRLRYTAVAVSRSYTNSRPSFVTTYTKPYFSLICRTHTIYRQLER